MPSRVDRYTPSAGDEASRRASQRVDALNRDPRFRRLDTATRQQAIQLVQVNRRNPRAAENIRALVTSDGFAQLNETHRRELLNALARAPGDARYAEDLRAFANSPEIRHLGDSAKSTLIGQLSLQNANDDARNTLLRLAQLPGFALMGDAEKNRLLRLVGGTNQELSSPNRAHLDAMLPALAGLPPQEQLQRLNHFLALQPGIQEVLGLSSNMNLIRASYRVHGPQTVPDYEFRSGRATALRYEVEIEGRRIPVFMPQNPDGGYALTGRRRYFHSIDEVARGLAALPPFARALVNRVDVNPWRNPDDPDRAQRYADPDFRSYLSVGADGEVNIYPSVAPPSQGELDVALLHEVGHLLSHARWGYNPDTDARWSGWRRARESDRVVPSRYADYSLREDFAETFTLYMMVQGTPRMDELRALMPARFRIIDDLLRTRP